MMKKLSPKAILQTWHENYARYGGSLAFVAHDLHEVYHAIFTFGSERLCDRTISITEAVRADDQRVLELCGWRFCKNCARVLARLEREETARKAKEAEGG